MAAETQALSEVIDLTEPTPPTTPKPTTSETERSTPVASESNRKTRRKKKKDKDATTQRDADADAEQPCQRGQKRKSPDTTAEPAPVESRRRRKNLADEEQRKQQEDEEAGPMEDDLFFVDVEPLAVPQDKPHIQPEPTYAPEAEQPDDNKLLLPAHVTVFGSAPVEIIAPATSLEDDSIQFLDYDDAKEFPRYYQSETQKAPTRTVCKRCGAENEHKTYECPVIICLTCGVRDEHPTRSCPISKVCFNCGMKGHISQKCPNRHTRGIPSSRFMDCERCYSSHHKTNECPTWWRIYLYLSDEGKAKVLSFREERQNMPLGDGGEGYVAGDEWCYNCAQCGHLGDDCPDGRQPDEPSAFSFHNVASGPFYDPAKDGESSKTQRPRRTDTFLDLEHVPDGVGRMGKDKSKSRLGKMLKDRVADDDQDDWFSRSAGGSSGKTSDRKGPPTGPRGDKTFNFGQSFRDRRDLQQPSGGGRSGSQPSLLSRMGGSQHVSNQNGPLPSSSKSSNKRKRERQRSPERSDYRSSSRRDKGKDDRGDYRKDHRSGGGGSHGGSSSRWERSHPRRDGGGGGGGGGGPRYRGSYNR